MLYEFPTHFRGMGQNEYLSQGKHNYAYNVDITSEPARFSQGDRPINCAKLGNGDLAMPKRIMKIEQWIYTLTYDGKVWFIPDAPSGVTMGASYDPTTVQSGTEVTTSASSASNMVVFADKVYVFAETGLYSKATSSVNGATSWGAMSLHATAISSPQVSQRPTVNYLDAYCYFGNGITLGKIDEFGIVTVDVLGRNFDSPIIGLTITGSVLNIYTRDGKKSLMDLSSETIGETVDLKSVICRVNNDANLDYLVLQEGSYGQIADGSSLAYSSAYQKQEIIRNSIARTLFFYDFFGSGYPSPSKFSFDANDTIIEVYNGAVYVKVADSYSSIFMFKNGYFSSVFTNLQEGTGFGDVPVGISAFFPNSDGLFIGYRNVNGYYYITQVGLRISGGTGISVSYASRKSALVENVFTGGNINYKKSLKQIRFRANVPTSTRLILKGVFDGTLSTLATIDATTKKGHIYSINKEFYEMMLIWEMYNDATDYTGAEVFNKVSVYDSPEIDFEIIET